MCKRKPFPIVPSFPVMRRLLSFTINDYPGNVNDLNGCINDGKQAKETVLTYWPDFDVKRFNDSLATVNTFKSEVGSAIASLNPGATILILPDSCFSGTVTKVFNFINTEHPTRNRFFIDPNSTVKLKPKVKTFLTKGDIRWIVISGCGETQYSADAYINGEYHGAFTYFAMKTLIPGITYLEWFNKIKTYLPSSNFEQAPTIEGPVELMNRIVFEDQTLVIHNSTHGTQLNGIYGDEDIDEAICLYDGNLRDNDYYTLLNKLV
jgi:hypothetical protein